MMKFCLKISWAKLGETTWWNLRIKSNVAAGSIRVTWRTSQPWVHKMESQVHTERLVLMHQSISELWPTVLPALHQNLWPVKSVLKKIQNGRKPNMVCWPELEPRKSAVPHFSKLGIMFQWYMNKCILKFDLLVSYEMQAWILMKRIMGLSWVRVLNYKTFKHTVLWTAVADLARRKRWIKKARNTMGAYTD